MRLPPLEVLDENGILIVDAEEVPVATVHATVENYQEKLADAQRIVRACNAYPNLVNALRAVPGSYDDTGCENCGVIDESVLREVKAALLDVGELPPASCHYCGAPLVEDGWCRDDCTGAREEHYYPNEDDEEPREPEVDDTPHVYCQRCGQELAPDDSICPCRDEHEGEQNQ